jgi:hypothetical protein
MNKPFCSFLLACASLAIPVYAAPKTVITALPFTITSPGTYELAGDLSFSGADTAIQISTATMGPVILDLMGFTITGNAASSVGISIGRINGPDQPPNAYPITIRNGTLQTFVYGVFVGIPASSNFETDITISHLTINTHYSIQGSTGIYFQQVNSSTVRGCTFNGGTYGVVDAQSHGGNSYLNCTFTNIANPISPEGTSGLPVTIGHYEFAPPPTN